MRDERQSAFGDKETKYFYELNPDRILDAVEAWGFRCTGRVLALNSMENRVYEVEIDIGDDKKPSRSHERFRIVKFYRPGRWSREQILEEHRFLLDLVEYDIPVVAPEVFGEGETLLQCPGIDIWCAMFPKVGGRNPQELDDEQLARVGRLLARMHNVGGISQAPSRIKIDTASYGYDNLGYLLDSKILPAHYEQRYEDVVRRLLEISAPWFEKAEVQRIHGDCHLGNLLWGEQGCFWVDFDDMLRGPCVQDLWLMLPGRDEHARMQMEVLLSAYEQMRPFDRSTLRLIEPLRSLRMIHFNAWIAKRWSDPAFPRTFVEFGTERYWNEQLRGLEEQLELVQQQAATNQGCWS